VGNPILPKTYSIETTRLSAFSGNEGAKSRGEKMKDSLAMSLKTSGEKMSVSWLLAILMKRQGVSENRSDE
jgi:hypothetical protein